MPQMKAVEKKIREIEGFDVRVKDREGKDIRGDKKDIPQYTFQNAAKKDMTVSEWKNSRFASKYPGFMADVLDGAGNPIASGQMKLETVRNSYLQR